MAQKPKRVSKNKLNTMTWEDMTKLHALGFPTKNLNKRRNRLYARAFSERYNTLLKTMQLLGLEQNTPRIY